MKFTCQHTDTGSKARAGIITTNHGQIETPIFMPVGTQASVKGIHQKDLKQEINPDIILANTYHLYLRPSVDILEQAGGIHKFMNWDRNLLTDMGYQVYSLAANRKIEEDGVRFKSHILIISFTLEKAIDIQRSIGADIIMAFDECPPYPCDYSYAKTSMALTHRWLDRCIQQMNNTDPKYGHNQSLFPIAGSTIKIYDWSQQNTSLMLMHLGMPMVVSVGEPAEEMYAMADEVCPFPKDNLAI